MVRGIQDWPASVGAPSAPHAQIGCSDLRHPTSTPDATTHRGNDEPWLFEM
jgi:hypothetical protein